MSHWNYRKILQRGFDENEYFIAEVFYNDEAKPYLWSPANVYWWEGEDPKYILDKMELALEKPCLIVNKEGKFVEE